MSAAWLVFWPVIAFVARIAGARRFWIYPKAFPPAYRLTLLAVLFFDAPLVAWLATSGRLRALVGEQFVALVLSIIVNRLAFAHFRTREAAAARPADGTKARQIHVSMAPRRLRDYTNFAVEGIIAAAILAALALVERTHGIASEPWVTWDARSWLRSVDNVAAWALYLQLGLLLLKVVFVRWRMALPETRTDDFRRWRTAWLGYHLRLLDSMRILMALAMLSAIVWLTVAHDATTAFVGAWVIALLTLARYSRRDKRRFEAVTREVNPLELAREFPRSFVSEDRFLLGFLYFDRETPGMLVQSGRGIALNLAHPTTYVWAAYLLGLIAVAGWVTR
jgi:hypothetical protein